MHQSKIVYAIHVTCIYVYVSVGGTIIAEQAPHGQIDRLMTVTVPDSSLHTLTNSLHVFGVATEHQVMPHIQKGLRIQICVYIVVFHMVSVNSLSSIHCYCRAMGSVDKHVSDCANEAFFK